MDESAIPYKFAYVWGEAASSGYITATIPTTASGAAASQQQGFPQITAANPGAGGIPPSIADFNGAFNYFSSWAQWMQAGGPVGYDSTFSTAIGGYPKGSILVASSGANLWISTADNNTTDPDTGGGGWAAVNLVHGQQTYGTAGTYTFTVPAPNLDVEVWSGGGGGSGAPSGSGYGGGGGGGYAKKRLTGLTVGATVTVNVGAGGAAGSGPGSPTGGGNGGSSSFGAYCSASGGSGGNASGGGAPGGGGGGDLNMAGGYGSGGLSVSGVSNGGGAGGSGAAGGGGGGGNAGGSGANAGSFPGGGGSGTQNGSGAAGAEGCIRITW